MLLPIYFQIEDGVPSLKSLIREPAEKAVEPTLLSNFAGQMNAILRQLQ